MHRRAPTQSLTKKILERTTALLLHQRILYQSQTKRARQKQYKDKGKDAKRKKKGGSVQNTIEEIIESSKLPPAEQALLPPTRLTTKVARPKKGRKKKGGGLGPILEHHDIQNDPYYMKPPLPTHTKHIMPTNN